MQKRMTYSYDINGNIVEYKSVQECANCLGVCKQTIYNTNDSTKPIKNLYFVGFDKELVMNRGLHYWNNKVVDSQHIQLSKEVEELRITVEKLKAEVELLKTAKTAPSPVVYAETQNKAEPQPHTYKKGELEPVIQTQTQNIAKPESVIVETREPVVDFEVATNFWKAKEEQDKREEAERKKIETINKMKGVKKEKPKRKLPKYRIGSPEEPEDFQIWYKSPIDGNYHFVYSGGFDLQDTWEVSEDKPYFYSARGELLNYNKLSKSERQTAWYNQAIDPVTGCEAWLKEREKFRELFGQYIDEKGWLTLKNFREFPEPVLEPTEEEGVYKVYDLTDFIGGKLVYLNFYDPNCMSMNQIKFPQNTIIERMFRAKLKANENCRIDLPNEDRKILSAGIHGMRYNFSALPCYNFVSQKDIKNYEYVQSKEEEVEK